MRALLIAFLCMLLAACQTPEPSIVTQTVEVAVPVPCKPNLGQRPALMAKEQIKAALATTPTFDDRMKIIAEQLAMYVGWTPVVEAGLKGCEGPIMK